MSLKISQFRSNNYNGKYYNSSTSDMSKIADVTNNILGGGDTAINFIDKGIDYAFQAGQNYYVKIKVKRFKNSDQTITLRLGYGENSTIDTYQFIDSFTVFSSSSESDPQYAIIEAIFQANSGYERLNLILNRTNADFSLNLEEEDQSISSFSNSVGRQIKIVAYEICNFTNLINNRRCVKIGIQGPTGMLMCINGEQIRIGPSGIYEIKNGYIVNFIGVVVKNSTNSSTGELEQDNFIIDYQYEE